MATYNTFKELAEHLGIDSNNPTPESQKIVSDWMKQNPEYEARDVTNKFMEGYQPPQDVVSPDPVPNNGFNGMPSSLQQHVNSTTPAGYFSNDTPSEPAEQLVQPESEQPVNNTRPAIESALNRGMQAWSPLAPTMIKGGDRSGEASGYRAGATIQDKAAADYSKIVQWNKQRATDNTLADKVAAAQASGQWRQNANALGAEGGASVVASQNQAVTPDIMAQKQYQTQQMQNAERNMSEVNARKIAAQNDRTKADMTDYNTQYNESRDAYAHNLATANGQPEKPAEKKEEPKVDNTTPETTESAEKPDGKVENTDTTNNTQQAAAEVNQQSQATETATQEISDDQKLKDLADEIEGIHKAVEQMKGESTMNISELKKQKARYDEIKPLFDELAAKSKNPPPMPAPPDFGMFNKESSKVPDTILTGVTQRF